jgi:pyruvate, water dikinase
MPSETRSRDEPILWLEDLHLGTAQVPAGSKMGRLADLARAGLAVPPAFVVTTAAYRLFCAGSGVEETIAEQLGALTDAPELARVEAASRSIRAAFEAAPMDENLALGVADAYEELCYRCRDLRVPTAVRSSATGEDSADASCAGQFDTYLGVTGAEAVAAAVKRCWASLFNTRAILYRLRQGLSHQDSPMAVGVLELIPARASGVGFSIHPVSGKRDRMVIEASWGFGEAVVQGLVTPDHVEVDKADRRILRHDVADKAVASTFDPALGRVVETEMPRRFRTAPVLDDEEIGAVAEAVLRIEELYGYPVDVEWVIDRNRQPGQPVTVVQTRPETVHAGAQEQACTPAWDPAAYAARYAFGQR